MTQAVDRLSHMRTHAVISRAIAAIACQIFKKRAKWARTKSAFDYKAINGAGASERAAFLLALPISCQRR